MRSSLSVVIILFWSLIFQVTAVFAQNDAIDSVSVVLSALPSDSARIAVCLEYARKRDVNLAIEFIKGGKVLAIKTNDLLSLGKLISEEAIIENMGGQHLKGAESFLQADSIYRMLNDSGLIAGTQTNAGLSYYHAGQYDKALECYFEAYALYDKLPSSTGYSRLLNNLAMCFKRSGEPDEAKKYYRQSIALKRSLGDTVGIAHTHHNLGLLLSVQDLLEEAVLSFDTAVAIYHAFAMDDDEASSNVALGKVLMDAGQLEIAYDHLHSGYQYFSSTDADFHELLLVAGDLAELAARQGNWEVAGGFVDEALALTTGTDRLTERYDLLQLRAEISYELGRPGEVYAVLTEASALGDSLNSQQRVALAEEMQARFSVREKEKDLQLTQLAFENERRILVIYKRGLILTLLIVILIGALAVFLIRSRKTLKRQQEIIELALREKNLLLNEIHHRVKNNLQIISSLLGMQSLQSNDPNVGSAMREGQNRVQSMALIHQSLYQDDSFIAVEADKYIRGLVDSLRRGYRIDPDRISIEAEVDPLRVSVDTMIPLGLILNELVTNALKYAFPGDRSGQILVSLKADDKNLILQISDDGIGVDPDALRQSNSMGFTLVSDFCAKLKAQLVVASQNGTTIWICVPDSAFTMT